MAVAVAEVAVAGEPAAERAVAGELVAGALSVATRGSGSRWATGEAAVLPGAVVAEHRAWAHRPAGAVGHTRCWC